MVARMIAEVWRNRNRCGAVLNTAAMNPEWPHRRDSCNRNRHGTGRHVGDYWMWDDRLTIRRMEK